MIDELCDQVADQKIAIACFYCDFQNQKMQTPENVLGALVKQIVRGLGAIPKEIMTAFRKAKGRVGGRGLRVPEALELLKATLAPLDLAFICIDALDELLEKHLPKLLRPLHDISQSCPEIRFFFTGRPHIKVAFERYFSTAVGFLQMKPKMEDITRYVEMMLDDDPDPEAMNADLQTEIMNRVSETISDVFVTPIFCSSLVCLLRAAPRFLLVSLNIAAILDETTIYDRREQLKKMTNGHGLGDAYHATLDRMKAQSGGKSRFGMAALMWISQSERPMSPDELCHVLGVHIGSTDPNPDSIPSIKTLLASCLGLVTVDEGTSTVRLVHFTLQEYLNSHSEMFQNPHTVMAEVCLTYLNFDCVRELPPTLDTAPQEYPFLLYASGYWGHYARNQTSEGVKSLALQLLDEFDSHISAGLLLRPHVHELRRVVAGHIKGFTGLHCVAYLGIEWFAEALLDMKDWDVDKPDLVGRTPLIWASKNGCEGIIRLLLGKAGANVNTKDVMYGQTPLSWAAEYGQEGAVKLLLERDEANPELPDDYGRTPLSHAAEHGREETVKLLLELEEVNPESRDNSGRTPLSHAAGGAGQRTSNFLLLLDSLNSGSQGSGRLAPRTFNWGDGVVPLEHGGGPASREGTLKLFLKRGEVNPESRDNNDRTPLYWAVRSGEKEIVKLLLERDEVNPESQDRDGETPLSLAIRRGKVEIEKLLLERQGVYPDSQDNFNRPQLSQDPWYSTWPKEAERGQCRIVRQF